MTDGDLTIRVGPALDDDRFLATDDLVWSQEWDDRPASERLLVLPRDQRFAAELPEEHDTDPASYAAIYGVYPLELSVPGAGGDPLAVRQVPCAGLTWVGVHPDHRRRGLLSAMMRHHLQQVHEDPGTSISALHASEHTIYGRYGYGIASVEQLVTLGVGTELTAPHLDDAAGRLTTRLLTVTDKGMAERMRDCHRRAAAGSVGAVVPHEGYYRRVCTVTAEDRRDKELPRVLVAQRDGVDVGMALLRRELKWENGTPSGEATVYSLVGDPAARLALLRRLVALDLVQQVKLHGTGAGDPVHDWVRGPRGAASIATTDSLWVRLVDLPDALAARGYAAACDLVVEVVDHSAPWNDGRWRFVVDDEGTAEVTRTEADADLRLPTDALGAAYLGGTNLLGMLGSGFVTEHTPGATRRLWRTLRTDLLPGAAIGF